MAEISSDAQQVLSKAGEGAKDFVLNKGGFGGKLTSGEATRLLEGFQGKSIYSGENVLNGSTNPQTAPNLSDPNGLYESHFNQGAVKDARDGVTAVQKRLNDFDGANRSEQNLLENQPLRLGVIRGEQQHQSNLRSSERISIAQELGVKQSALDTELTNATAKYQIAVSEREKMEALILETRGEAGIEFGDSFKDAVAKAGKYAGEQEEKDREQAEHDMLDQMLLSQGLSTSGSRKKKKKRLEKAGIAEKEYEDQMRDLQKRSAEASLSKSIQAIASGSTNSFSVASLFGDTSEASSTLNQSSGINQSAAPNQSMQSDDALGAFGF